MLLTNIPDYVAQNAYEIDTSIKFHIPDHPLYKELNFPYHFREEDFAILDSEGNFAVITAELLDSMNWAIITPHGDI
jgi:hypothetical protein